MLRPLNDRVLGRRKAAAAVSKGGIMIPDAVQDRPLEGTVVAMGPGAIDKDGQRIPMDFEIGDEVIFARQGVAEVTVDGEKLLIMGEASILGVIV